MDNVQEETLEASVMIKYRETVTDRNTKNNRSLLHEKRRHRPTNRYPQKVQATEGSHLLEHQHFLEIDGQPKKSGGKGSVAWLK